MQLPRLPQGVPRYVLNTGIAIFVLSLVLWSINALNIASIGSLRGRLTQPLHLDEHKDGEHNKGQLPSKLDATTDRRCHAVPNPPDVAVIVKTGANVLYDKVPLQLLSAWRCAEDPLIFSDLATTLGSYQVYDVLDNVTEAVKNSPDFDYYRKLQDYKKNGQDVRELRNEGEAGWKLDKYKFIPMLKKTWTMRPNHDWYVFLEGDTYAFWTNMLLWLQQFDPNGLYYLGEQTYVNNEGFAHGGSGFIISRGAMAKVLDDDPDITIRYDSIAQSEYYGDYVLMKALKEKGVELGLYKPMLQGEPPSSLRYGPGRYHEERYWCQPLISLHHVTPLDVDTVWQFEQHREDLSKPILFADMYQHFMAAHLPEGSDELEDWYNYSDDVHIRGPDEEDEDRPIPPEEMTPTQEQAYLSAEHCAAACAEYSRCMQYTYESSEQKCSYSFSYRFGEKRPPKSDGKRYKSGWIRSKIEKDIEENPCQSVVWKGFHTA
ncbi:conserved hypothetical protein [Talaromyces stipitatus ATCC 10500]|uniref:Apple domain-containing protein n=1 Tax=Talaromyces stipitatus (strain ATCC 10500 / CBS 375.48 / QM 6759 / NRRL 1006) TaxID=441959 RepID=B8M4W0_TALSN|nr:uncharacterized protein TSTA_026970 [Talaromyces stipitatus ATCC 10500]EED19395.1 conserved hypothetical protein [Talaromyces stipitatus ATCC 10500]